MKILGLDTATPVASAALLEEGKIILDKVWPEKIKGKNSAAVERPNHAETVLPLIAALLREATLSLDQISALAVSIGPGSFTGLRIGLSTVKGLTYGWNIPVVGVPTLHALAARVTEWEGFVCPILDARKKEVYAALFRKSGGTLERLMNDVAAAPEKILQLVDSHEIREPCLFIGDGGLAYEKLIRAFFSNRGVVVTLGEAYPSTAAAAARLAEARIQKDDGDSIGPLVPLYLRPSEAEAKRGSLTPIRKKEHL